LKKDSVYTEDQFDELQSAYEDMGMTWTCMYGFENTYGLAVRREIADQYGIETYSDLRAVASSLTFGAEYDFYEREDGYDALCDTYGFQFGRTMDLDIGLKYQALEEKQIDVMVVFTTDGQLSTADAVVLTDDLDFFPSYLCGNVVRTEVLDQYPELQDVFDELTGRIQNEDMVEMNYEVEVEGKEPRDVAQAFLEERGLIQ
jgi:osmoprotectant transport system permease protein